MLCTLWYYICIYTSRLIDSGDSHSQWDSVLENKPITTRIHWCLSMVECRIIPSGLVCGSHDACLNCMLLYSSHLVDSEDNDSLIYKPYF